MSESVNQSAPYTDTQSSQAAGRLRDREFSGEINRASAQGAKFGLLLAMLEQDLLHRPTLLANDINEPIQDETLTSLSYYPRTPLKAEQDHWVHAKLARENIAQDRVKSAQLWLVMHPQPLSLHNNSNRLDEEVIANCDIHTQQRLKDLAHRDIVVDETGLYDILQGLETEADDAA